MNDNDVRRISRLTAIVMQLQTKRLVTATELVGKFSVSVRTIYRDIRALEQAGIPILIEDSRGYSLMEDYRVPPVMFTESEANALTAEQLLKSKDSSLYQEFKSAIDKIRAVLRHTTKEKSELLSNRIAVSPAILQGNSTTSLTLIQNALTSYKVLDTTYHSESDGEKTERKVEPFALYYSQEENWLLIAFCRLRNDYRMFRLDKISSIKTLELHFKPHKLTLGEYLEDKKKKFTTPDIPLS
jgi:predicted DNA-binding transcriptional regulator YafY